MTSLVSHLFIRLMKKGRLIGLSALAVVPGLILAVSEFDGTSFQDAYAQVIGRGGFTFAIGALILGGATLREERDGGTLPYLYLRPISRRAISGASLVAGFLAAATIAAIAWLATVAGAYSAGGTITKALPGTVFFLTAAMGYSAVFVPLGYLVRRSLLFGLGYLFVIETIVAEAIPGLAQLSIYRICLSIYIDLVPEVSDSVSDELLRTVTPGVGGGLVKLAAVVALGFSILTWALRRRDAL